MTNRCSTCGTYRVNYGVKRELRNNYNDSCMKCIRWSEIVKKEKPCKKCGNKRYGNLTICYACFRTKEKEKREEKLTKLRERKKKKVEKIHNSYKYLHKAAWELFSKIIRMEGANEEGMTQCYTCGVIKHWKELQAGHYWHNKLDFDRRNVHPQCPQCNTYKSGMTAEYGSRLLDELGEEGMKQLDRDAHTISYTWIDLKRIIEELKLI